MSARRKSGDRVYKIPMSGFTEDGFFGIIQPEENPAPCMLDCGDGDCREWCDVLGDNGEVAYHVSECKMDDGPRPEHEERAREWKKSLEELVERISAGKS